MTDDLASWRVPFGEAEKNWKEEYGIAALYLNDIAAGVRIEIGAWEAKDAVERVSAGLRHILQELWHLDLVRPVLAVFTVASDTPEETAKKLRRLSWDDEWHRGDFALREAATPEAAETLLFTLMGDTMGALDDASRADKVGIPEVNELFKERLKNLGDSQDAADQAEIRLIEGLQGELVRARLAEEAPDLVRALHDWVSALGVDR